MRSYYVYIMTNKHHTVLYTGMTNDLMRRVFEHKDGKTAGFTQIYNVHKLIYFETSSDVQSVIAREKQIKGWARQKKIDLIATTNPNWNDLYNELMDIGDSSLHSE
ncbi:MAG: GIY-YIG nuclease family protein [Hyphomonadaceae bacterium]|nr:GIY-YIG nuclease family protein [Clostridia bacterium]